MLLIYYFEYFKYYKTVLILIICEVLGKSGMKTINSFTWMFVIPWMVNMNPDV